MPSEAISNIKSEQNSKKSMTIADYKYFYYSQMTVLLSSKSCLPKTLSQEHWTFGLVFCKLQVSVGIVWFEKLVMIECSYLQPNKLTLEYCTYWLSSVLNDCSSRLLLINVFSSKSTTE